MTEEQIEKEARNHVIDVYGSFDHAGVDLMRVESWKAGYHFRDKLSGWISVKDQLPEVNVKVQVWARGWKIAKRREVGETTLWHYSGDTLYSYEAPTHWMPLPEPPAN